MEHKSDGDTNCNWQVQHSHQRICTRTEGLGNKGTIRDQPNYCIIEIGQNTEKSPGDLRRLVTEILVKDHQLKLRGKLANN